MGRLIMYKVCKKDLKITSFNRFLEKRIINRLEKKNKFKKGEYYDKRG